MKVTNILSRTLNAMFKITAILLVVIAVLLSCLRLFLNHAHEYRQDLTDYINKTYQINVTIAELNSGWSRNGPTLVMKDIELNDLQDNPIFSGDFEVEVDFWASLLNRKLVTTDLTLSDSHLYFRNTATDSENDPQTLDIVDNLYDFFLNQVSAFSIQNSQLVFFIENKRRTLLINQMAWLNKEKSHRAMGDVTVDDLSSNTLKLIVDLNGSSKNELAGQAYFQATNINITPWLARYLALDNSKTNSSINFETWLTFKKGDPTQLQLVFGDNRLAWQTEQADEIKPQEISLSGGQIVVDIAKNFKRFDIYTADLAWQSNGVAQTPLNFTAYNTPYVFVAHLSELDINSLQGLSSLLISDEDTQKLLQEIAPQGQLSSVFLRYLNGLSAVAEFQQINTQYSHNIPGITHLNGELIYQNNKLALDIAANDGALDFGPHFRRAIPYQYLSAQALVSFKQGVLAEVERINLLSDELTMEDAALAVSVPEDQPASMLLYAKVLDADATKAKYYFPHLLMGHELVDYLDNAIVSGIAKDTVVKFDGNFADFPFTENPGLFSVDVNVKNSSFAFDPHWPEIYKMKANLNFTNNSMLITANSGLLSGLDVTGVQVAISDLMDERVLTVDAEINQQKPNNITTLMNASPLASSVGKVLTDLTITEPISGQFSLNLPLKDIHKAQAKGEINFNNNQVTLKAPSMVFNKVNGKLTFDNDKVIVNKLALDWRGMPLNINVAAKDHKDFYQTDIDIKALWQEKAWQKQVPESLLGYFAGKLDWQGKLSLFLPHQGGFSYQLSANSDLKNVAFALPAPYNKPKDSENIANVKVTGDEVQSNIDVTVGSDLSFFGVLNHQEAFLNRAHLVLGNEKMMLPLDGFHITANLEDVDLFQWQPFIADILSALPANTDNNETSGIIGQPERIRGTLKSLDIAGKKFNDVTFNLLDKTQWWLLQLNAKEARSQIKIFPDWQKQGLDINFDFLHMSLPEIDLALVDEQQDDEGSSDNPSAAQEKAPALAKVIDHPLNQKIFNAIPPLKVTCDSCRVGKIDLGKVSFEVKKDGENILSLNNFNADRKGANLTLAGQWLMEKADSSSQLEGKLAIKSIENEMDKFGFASVIKDSGMDLNFDINWRGSPQDFTLESLNGDINSDIDDGYLLDVKDRAKIFSLLSLQSIVRKLTFDFRDIFSDGMFYSQIKADFTLENGIIYTNNLKMKGSAGDLLVKGNTNLTSGGLDYRMSYKPNLTSSLPVLAWIATLNPVTFLAGVALDEVITSKVVSEFTFEVTGTVDDPITREVNRKNQDITVGRSTPPKIVEPATNDNPVNITPINPDTPIIEKNDG